MLKKTKEFRLAEWKKILAEANTSGMSKRAWCKANGISERKLYYWQHRIWQTESTGHHLSEKQELSVTQSSHKQLSLKHLLDKDFKSYLPLIMQQLTFSPAYDSLWIQ